MQPGEDVGRRLELKHNVQVNTERDNFYDWSKDKPDTGYAAFESTRQPLERARKAFPWRGMALAVVMAVAIGVLLKYLFAR